MNFEEQEDKDGVRMTWHHVPKLKLQQLRNVAPLACFYTPFNNKSEVTRLGFSHMQQCRQCRAFLNPYVTVKPGQGDVWWCQFCGFGNRLGVVENGSYSEALLAENTTVEYETGRQAKFPPVFFYVVDTCFEEDTEAWAALKELLVLLLQLLPENALVGMVSFGKHVQLHDLLAGNRCYTFNGSKSYSLEQVQNMLGLRGGKGLLPAGQRFLQPVQYADFQVSTALERLEQNVFPHGAPALRPERASGCAVKVAASVLEAVLGPGTATGGHVMCFMAGAPTFGPGRVVDLPLKQPIRSHHDIDKLLIQLPINSGPAKVDALLYKSAKQFYQDVARQFVAMGLCCDVFVGLYDQVGLYEMDEVCSRTGGCVVMTDLFATAIFRQSLAKFLQTDMALNLTLECSATSDIQFHGLIGHASALPLRKDRFAEKTVSPQTIGEGNTNAWKLGGVTSQSTYTLYLDKLDLALIGHAFVQFSFHYEDPLGLTRVRVTTVPLAVVADSDSLSLESGFDQEAAVVAIARNAVDKLQARVYNATKTTYDHTDVVKHLDKQLVDFCARFGLYEKKLVDLFRLASVFAMLPQFMYHLRRLLFIRVFNNSPDETAFIRHLLMHEDVNNCLIMIQPLLLLYDIDAFAEGEAEPEPVLLDSMSLGPTKILLLDTFFHILIYHGSTVALWRNAGYHNMEGYEHFRDFLGAPKKEAMDILLDRFPLPRFIDTDEGGSQARFLMAKLNPSTSYASNPNHLYAKLDVMTDDTNLQLFMAAIQRSVVAK